VCIHRASHKMSTKPSKSTASSRHNKQSRRKYPPKHSLPVSERLKRLFTSLVAQLDGGHHKNAIKSCDKILRLEPTDKDALQTKLFLLLQTDQYAAALALTEAASDHAYDYERVYSLYRLQRESEAAQVLDKIKKSSGHDRGVLHLEAQLSYRQGSYQNAFDLYNQLLDTVESHSDEQADILTNLEAAQKHLDFVNSGFLHALDTLPASLTKNLESNQPPTQPTLSAPVSHLQIADVDAGREPLVKTVRKRRVPKGVVPGVTPPPDPERWLKKSERASSFAQSGKRKKAGGGGAMQGTVESSSPVPSQAGKSGGGKAKRKK